MTLQHERAIDVLLQPTCTARDHFWALLKDRRQLSVDFRSLRHNSSSWKAIHYHRNAFSKRGGNPRGELTAAQVKVHGHTHHRA